MGKKKEKVGCTPTECGMEDKINKVMERFYHIAEKLTENQQTMQIQIQKLSDNVEGIKRLDCRLDDMEVDVKKNSIMMYKAMGIGMAVAVALPFIVGMIVEK